MACNCKHNEKEIEGFKSVIAELRELFIKRMTVDSDHHDSRRKDFNQAIFMWWNDEENRTPEQTFLVFPEWICQWCSDVLTMRLEIGAGLGVT